MSDIDWVRGDMAGLDIPTHGDALRAGGAEFLTTAFRSSGALPADNRVARITQCEECFGGGTGSKLLLAVEYERPGTDLPGELFVKFSRNFNDSIRDRSRHMMIPEVRFAALSRTPGFPITVPECLFADVHAESGSGLMITERLAFGVDGVERQYLKCMDYDVPEPLEHYRAVTRALARLSGTHRAGLMHRRFYTDFGFDIDEAIAADKIRYSEDQVMRRVARITGFISRYPQLFPDNLATGSFRARFARDVPRVLANEHAIRRYLFSQPDFIALCHWNANIDNGWYWRDGEGELQCGLLDWGRVGQMSVAQTIYGAFSGAEKQLWDDHLEDIVALFAEEFERAGGPALDTEELTIHTLLVTATMGLAYLLDAPAIIEKQLPDLAHARGADDERFQANEDARVQLHMLTMFLNQWETRNIGELIDDVVAGDSETRRSVM